MNFTFTVYSLYVIKKVSANIHHLRVMGAHCCPPTLYSLACSETFGGKIRGIATDVAVSTRVRAYVPKKVKNEKI